MKRLLGLMLAVILSGLVATPVFAQGPRGGDHVCFGGNTIVQGYTPNNVVLFGCGARISKDTRVERDVVSFGGNIVLEEGTQVGGDLVVFGGNAVLSGQVGHRVTMMGGTLTLEPGSLVQENVQVYGGHVDKKEGAVVKGELLRTGGAGESFHFGPVTPGFGPVVSGTGVLGMVTAALIGLMRGVVAALALAALGALTVVFLPAHTKQVGQVASSAALPSIGVGCLTVIGVMVLTPLLVIIIIGIPVALLLLLAFVVAGLFGWIALGRLVGERILEAIKVREVVPVVAVVVGILLLALLGAAPVLGGLVSLVLGVLGLGAVVLTRFGTQPYPPIASAPAAPLQPVVPPPQAVVPATESTPPPSGNEGVAS